MPSNTYNQVLNSNLANIDNNILIANTGQSGITFDTHGLQPSKYVS